MKNKIIPYLFVICVLLNCAGCKNDWLDIKPSKSLSVPETLNDLQSILDDHNVLNRQYAIITNTGTDNIFVSDANAGSVSGPQQDQYIWNNQINWTNESALEWNDPFTVINASNIVLDRIGKLTQTDPSVMNLKGQALFYRAYAYYTLSQVFCKPYVVSTAQSDLGLPIRLNSEVNEIQQRSSLQAVYDQMINDLIGATNLLPESGSYITRPNSIAAFAQLSRVYLTMGDYRNSKENADKVLSKKSNLIDYNDKQLVSTSRTYRFPANGIGNPEILFYGFSRVGNFNISNRGHFVQTSRELYNLYEGNDLRKEMIYSTSGDKINFVGSYTGANTTFIGISLNEIYLIRAECNTRLGNFNAAHIDLNSLLNKRYKPNTAPIISEANKSALMQIIINERRKELPRYGNTRWEDLRRYNLEPEYAVTQTRTFLGQTYTLAPNSPKYVLNIPNKEIRISGIEQNQR